MNIEEIGNILEKVYYAGLHNEPFFRKDYADQIAQLYEGDAEGLLTDEQIRIELAKAKDEAQLYGDDGKPLPEKAIAIAQARLKDEEWQKKLGEVMFEEEDVHVFDTSYGYNQVRIDHVFLNEDSLIWQDLKSNLKGE